MTSYIDLFHRIVKYNDKTVYIAFSTNTYQPYFHARQLCEMLGYVNCNSALKINVPNTYIMQLSDIDKNYKKLYKNVQGTTKFLSEAGMYKLIFGSNKKIAKEITEWITDQVLPSIRKFGEYKLTDDLKNKLDIVNSEIHNLNVEHRKQLKEKDDKIAILENNMKVKKHQVCDSIYLIRTIELSLDLDMDEKIDIKLGSTGNFNKRKHVLDTTVKNKSQLLKLIEVNDAKNIERCVFKKMEYALIKDKKDFVHCSYNEIMKQIASCIEFFEEKIIDIEPDVDVPIRIPSRPGSNEIKYFDFDRNKKYRINFIFDDSDVEVCSEKQTGGNKNLNDNNKLKLLSMELKYLKYKRNYLEFCSYKTFLDKNPDIVKLLNEQNNIQTKTNYESLKNICNDNEANNRLNQEQQYIGTFQNIEGYKNTASNFNVFNEIDNLYIDKDIS